MSVASTIFLDHGTKQQLTIGSVLEAGMVGSGQRRIISGDSDPLTYRDLQFEIRRLASMMRGLGVEPGDVVAVLDWDSVRYLAAYFAVPMMGAVLQTVNFRLAPDQIRFCLRQTGARVVIAHHDFSETMGEIRRDLPDVRSCLVIAEGAEVRATWADATLERALAEAPDEFIFPALDENSVATTFHTTGTTGLPKGVRFTHRQLVLHTLAAATALGADGQLSYRDVYMPLTPMFHVHAWGLPYVATMLGLTQVYPGRYDADEIVSLRLRHGVTLSHCVPTVLRMVLDAANAKGADLDGWKMLIGGSALTQELLSAGESAGLRLTAGYGMSETGPIVCLMRTSVPSGTHGHGRSGYPIPLVSAAVVDENMLPVPPDDMEQGELVVRSPWLTPGYEGDPTASDALWSGGWLHTQDIASWHEDGSVQIRDRLKDVIKSGGEWICSQTLEAIVERHPGVSQAAVIGVPHPHWQERPVAVVASAPGFDLSAADVSRLVDDAIGRGEISRHARLDDVLMLARLPLTSVGKIDKKAVRAWLLEQHASSMTVGERRQAE